MGANMASNKSRSNHDARENSKKPGNVHSVPSNMLQSGNNYNDISARSINAKNQNQNENDNFLQYENTVLTDPKFYNNRTSKGKIEKKFKRERRAPLEIKIEQDNIKNIHSNSHISNETTNFKEQSKENRNIHNSRRKIVDFVDLTLDEDSNSIKNSKNTISIEAEMQNPFLVMSNEDSSSKTTLSSPFSPIMRKEQLTTSRFNYLMTPLKNQCKIGTFTPLKPIPESSFKKPLDKSNTKLHYKFKWQQKQDEVRVCGTWDQWQTCTTLTRKTAHEFELTLELAKGLHLYAYLVDGEFRSNEDEWRITMDNVNFVNMIIIGQDSNPEDYDDIAKILNDMCKEFVKEKMSFIPLEEGEIREDIDEIESQLDEIGLSERSLLQMPLNMVPAVKMRTGRKRVSRIFIVEN
jgi:hypothetical protein